MSRQLRIAIIGAGPGGLCMGIRLKSAGFTILLVEQNFRFAATVADRHYVMEHGRVVDLIPNADLAASMPKLHDYLGV